MPEHFAKLCENCCRAVQALGLSRPILICNKKSGCNGKFFVVWQKDTCKNFKAKKNLPDPEPPVAEGDNVRFIPLTKGKFAIVDADDYEWLAKYKWYTYSDHYTFYICRWNSCKKISMHRQIMNPPEGLLVDHIDGNGLNNRKSNLRLCTRTQNARNRRPKRNGSSKFKGVYWHIVYRKWAALIRCNGKQTYLGRFDNEIEAALVYDRKAEELFGEFAYLNFPELAAKAQRNLTRIPPSLPPS